jgi:hypothetical protein
MLGTPNIALGRSCCAHESQMKEKQDNFKEKHAKISATVKGAEGVKWINLFKNHLEWQTSVLVMLNFTVLQRPSLRRLLCYSVNSAYYCE